MATPDFHTVLLYIALIWLVVILSLGLKALIYFLKLKAARKASRVYEAIRAAGNWQQIRPTPSGIRHVPAGMSHNIITQNGNLMGGIGIVLINNDASFWLKDNVFYVVNEEAKKLLPNAPQAPAQITDIAVHAVAK